MTGIDSSEFCLTASLYYNNVILKHFVVYFFVSNQSDAYAVDIFWIISFLHSYKSFYEKDLNTINF